MLFHRTLLLLNLLVFMAWQPSLAKKIIKKTVITEEVEVDDDGNEITPFRDQLAISLSAYQLVYHPDNPLSNNQSLTRKGNKAYIFSIGTNYYGTRISGELIAMPYIVNQYDYKVPYGTASEDRYLDVSGIGFNAQSRWLEWEWIDIYTGFGLHAVKARDNVKTTASIVDSYDVDKTIFYFSPSIGMQIFPRKALSFFIDARLGLAVNEVTQKKVIQSNAIGTAKIIDEKLDLSTLMVGVGMQWNF